MRRSNTAEDEIDEGLVPCREEPDLWFSERPDAVEEAKVRCGPCPLRTACLAAATCRREPWGVWGGEVFVDGVPVRRKRGPGRPRRCDLAA